MRYWMKVIVAATALSASFVAAICGIVVGVSRLPEPAGLWVVVGSLFAAMVALIASAIHSWLRLHGKDNE